MKNSSYVPFIVSWFVFGSFSTNLNAESWPQFRGPDRTGVSASVDLLTSWPEDGPKRIWTAKGAGRGYSSLSFSGGRFFTLGDSPSTADDDQEYLSCFDQTDGRQIWKTKLGAAWKEGPDDWQSSRSTPTIDGNRIYVLTAHGDLCCVDARRGDLLWSKNLKDDFGGKKGDGWGYSESILIDGDRLICTPGGSQKTMVALNKSNGELIWSAARDDDRGAGHASIVISEIDGIRIYVQTTASGALGVRATDGERMWSYEIDRTTAVIPTPIVRDDHVFFTAGYNRGGALLKQKKVANNRVEIEEVYPLNKKLQNKHGGIVLVGNEIYGDSGDGGIPFCADLLTGKIHWKKRGSGKGSASVTSADGHLYIWFSNGVIALAEASKDSYQEISTFKIEEGGDRPAWAHPVVYEGRLYLRMDDQIFAFELRSRSDSQ